MIVLCQKCPEFRSAPPGFFLAVIGCCALKKSKLLIAYSERTRWHRGCQEKRKFIFKYDKTMARLRCPRYPRHGRGGTLMPFGNVRRAKGQADVWACALGWRQPFMTKQCACNSTRTNEPHTHTHTNTRTHIVRRAVKECENWSTKTDSHKARLCAQWHKTVLAWSGINILSITINLLISKL